MMIIYRGTYIIIHTNQFEIENAYVYIKETQCSSTPHYSELTQKSNGVMAEIYNQVICCYVLRLTLLLITRTELSC